MTQVGREDHLMPRTAKEETRSKRRRRENRKPLKRRAGWRDVPDEFWKILAPLVPDPAISPKGGRPDDVQATRCSVTTGRRLRPAWNVTASSSRTPGWPMMSTCGLAHGEPNEEPRTRSGQPVNGKPRPTRTGAFVVSTPSQRLNAIPATPRPRSRPKLSRSLVNRSR
jgi:hypothetical protein